MSEARFEDADAGPALDNGILRVLVHLQRGTFDLIDLRAGRTVLRDAGVALSLLEGPALRTQGDQLEFIGTKAITDVHGHGNSMIFVRDTDPQSEPELSFTITLYDGRPFAIVRAEVQNLLPTAIRVRSFTVLDSATLDVGAPAETLAFYKHGWQSWSPTLVLDCGGEDIPASPPVIGQGTQPEPAAGRFISDLVTAVVDPQTNYGLVAGFTSAAEQFSHLYFDRDSSSLSAVAWADGVELAPKQVLTSEALYLHPSADPTFALMNYGSGLAREMDAMAVTEVGSGWCSWYYYFQNVSEAEVLANLQCLMENRHTLPVEYVQIDDGYQSEIGDWLTPNEKFPHGMKWIADEIHAAGYKAGLWLAPFIAGVKSRLFVEHPEWFVKFTTGAPAIALVNWEQVCHSLDLTRPEVLTYLKELFHTICDEWGYDYVKIDFVYAGAIDGIRHDPTVTRAQAYRRGLQAIRDAVGSRFILACGNPMGPSVGLVEGARIGPDVAPFWRSPLSRRSPISLSSPAALNSIRNTITRFWMHGRLWANDPDCLLVRETETSLAGDEVRTLATAIALSGGMVLNSDKLPSVSDARRELISLLLPVYGRSAIPLDLFQTLDLPALFSLDCGTHRLLGVFNWGDESAEVEAPLPAGSWHIFEFWEREYLGLWEGTISLPTPPHGCRLLRLTPDLGHRQIVGSTLHITMGAMEIESEDWDGDKLRVALRPVAKRDGEIYIARDGRTQEIRVDGLVEARTIEV